MNILRNFILGIMVITLCGSVSFAKDQLSSDSFKQGKRYEMLVKDHEHKSLKRERDTCSS